MVGLFPRIHRVCTRENITVGCPERMRAEEWGDFWPDETAWGWVSSDTPLRYMSDASFHETYIHRRDYKHVNHSGRPYTYTVCPWCFGDLPSIGAIRKARGEAA